MPIYEFKCDNCGKIIEKIFFSFDEITAPICCNKEMKQIVSLSTFKLRYNNKTDMCDWNGNSTQYYRKDIDWDKGPTGLPGNK